MSTALITGGSQGLGRALTIMLLDRGWQVVVDARGSEALDRLAFDTGRSPRLTTVQGDVSDADHRQRLVEAVERVGELQLLVNNASTLGPTPLRPLASSDLGQLIHVFAVNADAPVKLSISLLPWLRRASGMVVHISSDAAVEHYPGWGLYGAAKAALDHLTLTLAAENSDIHWYAFDPGDMRTAMHQQAFPGEDVSDRPLPETVVPALLRLVAVAPVSGRYRASDISAKTENLGATSDLIAPGTHR